MKKSIIFIFLFFLLAYLSSCSSKKTLTKDLRESAEKAGIDMKSIQYYTARKIVLKREISSSDANVKSGKIKFEQGKYINIIKINRGTPGICLGYDIDVLYISFEAGSNSSLPFSRQIYEGQTINNEYWLRTSPITYNGEIYYLASSSPIKIKNNIFKRTKVKKRRLRGRKL
jgi:hypothetical protein